jgi:hypothetical protein
VMVEDEKEGGEGELEERRQLDLCAEGFEVRRLRRLIGSGAADYTAELEDLYEKMLAKVESLARQVELSSAKVFEQVSFDWLIIQQIPYIFENACS